MNVTGADYKEFKNAMLSKLKTPSFKESETEAMEARIEFETREIKRQTTSCPLYVEDRFRLNISGIQDETVKTKLREQFYNPDVMKGASCAIDAMYYDGSGKIKSNITTNQMIRRRIRQMKILASGAFGTAASITLGDANDIAVLKFPKRGTDSVDITHELFVTTIAGVNNLRKVIPNFSYVFGGFRCAPPIVDDETGDVTGWCAEGPEQDKVQFLLMENIAPSIDATGYIKNATAEQTVSLYFQAILALDYANQTLDFTHYDAHTGNLLMRDISDAGFGDTFLIPYPRPDGTTMYVKADRVATFIDYGMAGVSYKGNYYGIPNIMRIPLAIFPDRSWPLHDAYKLLMFLIMDAEEANNTKALAVLTRIFRFFNETEDPLKLAKYVERGKTDPHSQWPQRFALPYIKKATQYTMSHLIDYMIATLRPKTIIFSEPIEDVPVLECGNCTSFKGVLAMSIKGSEPQPKSFFDLYDISQKIKLTTEIKKAFPYQKAREEWLDEMEELNKKAMQLESSSRLNLSSFGLTKKSTVQMAQNLYKNIYELYDCVESRDLMFRIGNWITDRFSDSELKTYILRSNNHHARKVLCELVKNAIENYDDIQKLIESKDWDKLVENRPYLSWYLTADIIFDLDKYACSE